MRYANPIYWVFCAGLFACFLIGSLRVPSFLAGENDFAQFYSAGMLAGGPELYSSDEARRIQVGLGAGDMPAVQRNVRLPFHAGLMKPLTVLPYRTAHLVFQAAGLGLLLLCIALFTPKMPELPLLAALSLPIVASVKNGQDSLIVAALVGFGMLLASRGNDFAAGLVLSLCAMKFHLFLLVPVAILMQRRWGVLKGGAAGGAALLAASFLAGGLDWPARLWESATDPSSSPGLQVMPTVHGLAASFGWTGMAEWALIAGVAAVALLAMRRAGSLERSVAIALIGGLLLAYHAYMQDAVVLLVALPLLVISGVGNWPRGVATAAVLPPVYYVMIDGPPWNGVVHAILVAALVLLARGR